VTLLPRTTAIRWETAAVSVWYAIQPGPVAIRHAGLVARYEKKGLHLGNFFMALPVYALNTTDLQIGDQYGQGPSADIAGGL
jgi:hypothetical protein